MTAAGKSALFWLVLVVTACVIWLTLGPDGPLGPAADTWINVAGGLAAAASGVFILWRFRAPGSTPEAIRAPLRMLAVFQTLLGVTFVIPDISLRAVVLAIVVIPMFVAGVRLRRALRMMKKAGAATR